MKQNITFHKIILFSIVGLLPSQVNASIVSLDFSNIEIDAASSTTYSTDGDMWRATNVRKDGGPAMDAIFTITGSVGVAADDLKFVDDPVRGNKMRVMMNNVDDAAVHVTISFVNMATYTPYTGYSFDETLVTQFSDLDSDLGINRSDFGGVRSSEWLYMQTSNDRTFGTSLLGTINGPAYAPDYTVGILNTPWLNQKNFTDYSQSAQAPVTINFIFGAVDSIDMVFGTRSDGSYSNRYIDFSMPDVDYILPIPEPSSTIILSALAGMYLGFFRNRIKVHVKA